MRYTPFEPGGLVQYRVMRTLLIIVSNLLTVIATVPYLYDTARGKSRPRLVSWFIWFAIMAISAAASLVDGQLPAGIFALACALECGLVVVLGYKIGDRSLDRLDIICLAGAAVGLGLLVIVRSPVLAVVASILIDFTAGIPTLKHAYLKPREETWTTYGLYGLASGITLLLATAGSFTGTAYPLYLFVFDSGVAAIILISPNRALRLALAQPDGLSLSAAAAPAAQLATLEPEVAPVQTAQVAQPVSVATATHEPPPTLAPVMPGRPLDGLSTIAIAITSPAAAHAVVGLPFTFMVTAVGRPTAPVLRATGLLPNGFIFAAGEAGVATIAGTAQPGAAGTYSLAIVASTSAGTITESFTLFVDPAPAMVAST